MRGHLHQPRRLHHCHRARVLLGGADQFVEHNARGRLPAQCRGRVQVDHLAGGKQAVCAVRLPARGMGEEPGDQAAPHGRRVFFAGRHGDAQIIEIAF